MDIELVRTDRGLINQVVELGTKNSKTLGHFPEGAYFEHARKGFLLCAFESQELLGYLLFYIVQSKNSIKIIQLCTSNTARKRGISVALLDALKEKFRESFKGITLSCRTDYIAASALWEKYGFKAMDKVRSRSIKENWLYKWWYDFGNHDLFSLSQSTSSTLKVVLDANIIIKLRSNEAEDKSGTNYLLEDWLIDTVDYYYAPEIYNEIKRDGDDQRARKTRSFLSEFTEAKFDPDIRDEIFQAIDTIISGNSPNDLSDKRQLSECIASDIPYFVTTDEKVLDADDQVNQLFGIRILRPIDMILLIDQNNNKADYVSTRIAGVNYDYNSLKSKEIDSLIDVVLVNGMSEKKHNLRETFTRSSSNVKECQTKILRDKNQMILGVWICELSLEKLSIPLIRTTKTKLAGTLFTQFISEALEYALRNKRNIVSISDKFISSENQEILEAMGFTLKDESWQKITIPGVIDSAESFAIQEISQLYDQEKIKNRLINSGNNSFRIGYERKLWPLKFNDVDIPVYIVPIRPHWASELFDHYVANTSIFGANASLAWSRENIYYRNTAPVSEKTPARLLWYSSSTRDKGATRTNSIVACSYLDEVHIGQAKELFRRFRHYGVYKWANILELAKGDPSSFVKVLKFSDTEVFRNVVPYKHVTRILQSYGRSKNTFTAPLEITNEIFLEIYKLGGII